MNHKNAMLSLLLFFPVPGFAQKPNLDYLLHKYEAIIAKHGFNEIDAIVELVQDRDFFPEKGLVHIMGSAENFYEWMIFVLFRSDMHVHISGTMDDLDLYRLTAPIDHKLFAIRDPYAQINQIDVNIIRHLYWPTLQTRTPRLFELSPYKTSDKLIEAMKTQTVTHSLNIQSAQVGLSDVILAISPRKYESLILDNLKEEGLLWLTTEFTSMKPQGVEFNEFHGRGLMESISMALVTDRVDNPFHYRQILGPVGAFLPAKKNKGVDFSIEQRAEPKNRFFGLYARDHHESSVIATKPNKPVEKSNVLPYLEELLPDNFNHVTNSHEIPNSLVLITH